jgi:hypothetical protein
MAIAGMRYAPSTHKLSRMAGMFLNYAYYLNKHDFYSGKFSVPPDRFYDPTDKSQFSNLAGKTIADFLSKKIHNSKFTVNYEAAMKHEDIPILGSRPDLIAFTEGNEIFSIEAKGYSKGTSGDMDVHKAQSLRSDPRIPVDFSVASVSYNMYDNLMCKYHDPEVDNPIRDNSLLVDLSKNYYKDLLSFMEFPNKKIKIQEEEFYEVSLINKNSFKQFDNYPTTIKRIIIELDHFGPKLILPGNIELLAERGLDSNTKSFNFESNYSKEGYHKGSYIDNDRVGILVADEHYFNIE